MTSVRDLPGRAAALAVALGDAAPSGRVLDSMRRTLLTGKHDAPAVADLLATFRREDDAAENNRISRKTESRARTVAVVKDFTVRREQETAPPDGRRFVHLRDEVSGQLHRLAIPNDWFADEDRR